MKLPGLAACCVAAAFTCGSCDRSVGHQEPVQRLVQGRIVSVGADKLKIRPSRNAAASAADEVIMLCVGRTSVNVQHTVYDAVAGKMETQSLLAALTDLQIGDIVSVSTRDGIAVSIRMIEPAPIRGDVVRIDKGELAVKPLPERGAGTERQEVSLVAGDAAVVAQVGTSDRYEPRQLSDLRPGDFVQVLAKGGKARIIGLVPRPPVQRKLVELTSRSIIISPTTRPGEPEEVARKFLLDPTATRYFHMYLGLSTDPASFSELAVGQSVEVSAKDGAAEQVRIVHSPIHRALVSVGDNYIVVNRNPQTPNERFTLTASTRIVLPKVLHRSRSPRGAIAYSYVYAEGYHLSDLRAGDMLSLTVRNGVAAEIRVTPRPEQLASSK